MKITTEEFNAWRANNITRAVFAALRQRADQEWIYLAEGSRPVSETELVQARAKYEVLSHLEELEHDDIL